jgi:hypothetical protein
MTTRLQTLRNRRDKLILANESNHYTQTNNPKIDKYYRILLAIKKEINEIECVNVRPPKARVGLTIFELKKQQYESRV